MEPILGFLLFGLAVIVVTVVAAKRNGVGVGFLSYWHVCSGFWISGVDFQHY